MRRSTPVLLSLAVLAFTLVTPTQATSAPADDVKLVTKKLLDGRLTMKVPVEFEPMDKKMLEFKYPRLPRPQAVFTDDAAATNIAFSHTKNRVTMEQLDVVRKQVEKGLKQAHAKAEWLESKIVTIGDRKWFRLDLRTQAIDTKVHNIMMGTELDGRLLMVTFNTTVAREKKWVAIGKKALESMRIPSK